MIILLGASLCPKPKDKDFLLKIYLEKHELRVDSNSDQRNSTAIITMTQYVKIVTETIEKENTRDQRKLKLAQRLCPIRIKTDAFA